MSLPRLLLSVIVVSSCAFANTHDDNLIVTRKPCGLGADCSYASYHLKFVNHLAKLWPISFTLNDVLPQYDNLTEEYHVTGKTKKTRIDGIYKKTAAFHVVIPEGVDFDWDVDPIVT